MMRPRTNRTIKAGTRVTESSADAAMAKVFVKASGPNSRPSWFSRVKIGRNPIGDHKKAEEERWPDLARGLDEDLDTQFFRVCALEMLVRALDHHDGSIDHGPDGDRDASEAAVVRAQADVLHSRVKSHEDTDRKHQNGDKRTSQVQQKHDADQRHDGAFLDQGVLQRLNRGFDQLRAVIDRDDLGAARRARRDLR